MSAHHLTPSSEWAWEGNTIRNADAAALPCQWKLNTDWINLVQDICVPEFNPIPNPAELLVDGNSMTPTAFCDKVVEAFFNNLKDLDREGEKNFRRAKQE